MVLFLLIFPPPCPFLGVAGEPLRRVLPPILGDGAFFVRVPFGDVFFFVDETGGGGVGRPVPPSAGHPSGEANETSPCSADAGGIEIGFGFVVEAVAEAATATAAPATARYKVHAKHANEGVTVSRFHSSERCTDKKRPRIPGRRQRC